MGCLIVLLLALQYRLWLGNGSIQEVWSLHRQLIEQRGEMQELITRNQALEAEVSDLKSGLDAIEERARARLGMIDEGETFYQFVRDRAGKPAGRTGAANPVGTPVKDSGASAGDKGGGETSSDAGSAEPSTP